MKTIEISLRSALRGMELINDNPYFKKNVNQTSTNTYEIEDEDLFDEVIDMLNANDIEIL